MEGRRAYRPDDSPAAGATAISLLGPIANRPAMLGGTDYDRGRKHDRVGHQQPG
jgi:hypothetical protein